MLVAAARAADGKLPLGPTFLAILLALILGGLVQFGLARGVGRGLLYRHGRFLGLSPDRLNRATKTVQRGNLLGIALAILTPGVRSVTVVACGLASLPLRVFLPGLALGSTAFLALHFALGYAGGALLGAIIRALPLPWLLGLVVLLAAGLLGWVAIRFWQRPNTPPAAILADAAGAWHEATCPVCLALGAIGRLPSAASDHP
jgi:membrane protein DedA with SNARE-associated domain